MAIHSLIARTSAAILMLSTAAIAQSDDKDKDQWIASLRLGATLQNDVEVFAGPAGADFDASTQVGIVPGAQIAKDMGKWRLSFDYDHRISAFDDLQLRNGTLYGLPSINGRALGVKESRSYMVNAAYKVAESGDWKAFVGAGLGLALVEVNNLRASRNNILLTDDDADLAGQVFGEAVYDLSNNWEIGLGARYWRTAGISMGLPNAASTIRDRVTFEAVDLFARIGFKFGGTKAAPKPVQKPATPPAPAPRKAAPTPPPPAPAPKPEPKPEPKPMPAPLPAPVSVFFDFDSAALTPTAKNRIAAIGRAYKKNKEVIVLAVGHADRAGATGYNERLSEKRVKAVKAALIAQGIPARDIRSEFRGERDPAVTTPDGRREERNRRVEISFSRK